GLKGGEVSAGVEVEALRHQARGLVALAEVGVPLPQVALWYAVVGKEQPLRPAMVLPVAANAGGKGVDIGREARVLVDETQFGEPAAAAEVPGNGIEGRRAGGRGILGVEGQHQQ